VSLEPIGALLQDLFHSDNAKVNAAFNVLNVGFLNDKTNCEKIHAVGGCFALVLLAKNCLEKAIEKITACDQVTGLYKLAELETLYK
jgi:hypothetical protein